MSSLSPWLFPCSSHSLDYSFPWLVLKNKWLFSRISVCTLMPTGARRACQIHRSWVTGGCEQPDVSAEKQTQAFWKSSKWSLPLSPLSPGTQSWLLRLRYWLKCLLCRPCWPRLQPHHPSACTASSKSFPSLERCVVNFFIDSCPSK